MENRERDRSRCIGLAPIRLIDVFPLPVGRVRDAARSIREKAAKHVPQEEQCDDDGDREEAEQNCVLGRRLAILSLTQDSRTSGVIVFEPIPKDASLRLILEGYSDNSGVGDYGSLTRTFTWK